ncbi:MAG: ChbG/HpnK family deacetylase, partial [Chloroflexi bacterium]
MPRTARGAVDRPASCVAPTARRPRQARAVKRLIVNADDFGLCAAVNRGTARAHDAGVVSSASLMVRRADAEAASALAGQRPALSLGLHLDIAEWVHGADGWAPRYRVVDAGDAAAVRAEARRQLERFRALCNADPTHIDSHQHVHREEPCATVVRELGAELGVPVREATAGVTYRGDFYGQTGRGDPLPAAITVAALIRIVDTLPDGITELGCHPAVAGDIDSVYG